MGRLSKGLNLSVSADASKFIKRLNEQFKQLAQYNNNNVIFDRICTKILNQFGGKIMPVAKYRPTGEKYIALPNTKQTQALASAIEKALTQSGYKTAAERRAKYKEQAQKIKQETKDPRRVSEIINDLRERSKLFDYINNNADFAYNDSGEMFSDITDLTGGGDFNNLSTKDLKKLKRKIDKHKTELKQATSATIEEKTGYNILLEEWKKPK